MTHDFLAYGVPCPYPPSTVALARVSNQTCADPGITVTLEVRSEQFVDEALFSLALDMNQ